MPVLCREEGGGRKGGGCWGGVGRARRDFEASKLSTGVFLIFNSYVMLKV